MIIILSINGDTSTDEVCRNLSLRKIPYIRINDDLFTKESDYKIALENDFIRITTKTNNLSININEKHILWNRKFGFYQNTEMFNNTLPAFENDIIGHLSTEYYSFTDMLRSSLNSKNIKWLLPYIEINKSQQLAIATSVGFKTPKTIITNDKDELISFLQKNKNCILKPLKSGKTFFKKNYSYPLLTFKIKVNKIHELPNTFLPSIFQECIEKEFEIRSFVLGKKIFSMAIFSQDDNQTEVDFRNYNIEKPNRTVPYNLPEKIELLIHKFMIKSNLNTGSIDIIKSTNGQYYFLEINPSGQFGMVSYPCNYNLEHEITNYLNDYERFI